MPLDSETVPRLEAEQYDEMAPELPDYFRYHPGARHRRRIILKLIEGLPFRRLLDVGCGNAELLTMIRPSLQPGQSLEGSDVSPVSIEANQKRCPDVRFHTFDIERSPLPANEFDLIICSEVIEHLDDQPNAVKHLAAGVAPGGHLVITTPTGRIYPTERHFGHTRHPTPADLRDYAATAGLEVVKVINWGFPLYKPLKWATNVNADWAVKNFATGQYSTTAKLLSNILYGVQFFNLNSSHGCQLFGLFRKP